MLPYFSDNARRLGEISFAFLSFQGVAKGLGSMYIGEDVNAWRCKGENARRANTTVSLFSSPWKSLILQEAMRGR